MKGESMSCMDHYWSPGNPSSNTANDPCFGGLGMDNGGTNFSNEKIETPNGI